jgi:hypothetical protein
MQEFLKSSLCFHRSTQKKDDLKARINLQLAYIYTSRVGSQVKNRTNGTQVEE